MSTSLHSLRGHDLLHTGLLRGRYDLMIVTQLRPVTCNEAAPTERYPLSAIWLDGVVPAASTYLLTYSPAGFSLI